MRLYNVAARSCVAAVLEIICYLGRSELPQLSYFKVFLGSHLLTNPFGRMSFVPTALFRYGTQASRLMEAQMNSPRLLLGTGFQIFYSDPSNVYVLS